MTQLITQELKQWIVAQAQAGHSPESVLAAMKKSGWDEDIAIQAMESTLSQHLGASDIPAPSPELPFVALSEGARTLDLGGTEVGVVMALDLPRVVVLSRFLSDEECDALIAAAQPRLARPLTVHNPTGGEEVNEDRTSNGMFFGRGESELLRTIEARIARLVNWPLERGEGMQVLHYGPGAQYKPHYDYFDESQPGTPTILRRGGQRVGTLVMYLNNPESGGATTFPDAGLEVMPHKGHAVFFSYDRPHPMTRSLHGGAPVQKGEKWVATKWLRQGVFQ